jgi:hypothetical protein
MAQSIRPARTGPSVRTFVRRDGPLVLHQQRPILSSLSLSHLLPSDLGRPCRARGARTRRRPPYKKATLVQIPFLHHAPPPLRLPPLAAAAASAPLQVRSRRSTSLLRHLHSSQASPHACLLAPGAGESVDLAWLAATGSLLGRASVGVVGCGLFCVCVNSSF